jgi:hypothetical protein
MNKNEILKHTMEMICAISDTSLIKNKRNYADYFSDKLRQAASENNLQAMIEKLCNLMECSSGFIISKYKKEFKDFCKASANNQSVSVLKWLRNNTFLSIMTCLSKKEWDEEALTKEGKKGNYKINPEYYEIIDSFEIEDYSLSGVAPKQSDFDINIEIECLSPFAHGGDIKAGNATLFRRMQILSTKNETLDLPFYAGNSLRGKMRDLLADHFLKSLGLEANKTRPPIALWFFHSLYAGGALKSSDTSTKKVIKKLGNNGALDSKAIHEFRQNIPMLSLLGSAIGNRILEGKVNINDLRPVCHQWGFDSDIDVSDLFTWEFLTRREDHEEHEENSSMIANTEVLKSGTILKGGIDINDNISGLERSTLSLGITLLKEKGYLGAENRRGFGKVEIQVDIILADSDIYKEFLKTNKSNILEYISSIGAIE